MVACGRHDAAVVHDEDEGRVLDRELRDSVSRKGTGRSKQLSRTRISEIGFPELPARIAEPPLSSTAMAGRFEATREVRRGVSIASLADRCVELVRELEAAAQAVAKSNNKEKPLSKWKRLAVIDQIGCPRDTPLDFDDVKLKAES